MARRYFEDAELDLKFLCQQSEDYCVAYFLHHLFDLYEELFPKYATISDRRHAARNKMEACFGHKCLGGNLLSRYGMRSYYKKAEDFFKGPKSQYWLDNRFAKYYKQKKDKDL